MLRFDEISIGDQAETFMSLQSLKSSFIYIVIGTKILGKWASGFRGRRAFFTEFL